MKMKLVLGMMVMVSTLACNQIGSTSEGGTTALPDQKGGQSAVVDDVSTPDIVKVAVGSADHTTLVAALKAAEYVDVLSNAGPFTVFAPVNAAFDALPKGTLDDLLKKENQSKLRTILEYHVYVGKLNSDLLQDGQVLGMASGHNANITRSGDDIKVNGASVKATVNASNGIIYVIDQVLLPPSQ